MKATNAVGSAQILDISIFKKLHTKESNVSASF